MKRLFAFLTTTCLLVATSGSGMMDVEPTKNKSSKAISPEILKAWTDASAEVGWMTDVPKLGEAWRSFAEPWRINYRAGAVPAFRLYWPAAKKLKSLPDPGVPFGIELACVHDYPPDALKLFAGLKNLYFLDVLSNDYDDAWLDQLAQARNLQALYLGSSRMSNNALKKLKVLKNLKTLDISFAKITDEGLNELFELNHLQDLYLVGTKVTDAGVKQLVDRMELRRLDLAYTKLTDEGLKSVAGFKKLIYLSVEDTPVTDQGLQALAVMESLQRLDLSGTKVTEVGLKYVQKIKNLRSLFLIETKTTDAGLANLIELKKLEYLDVRRTKVTSAGIAKIQKALPSVKIRDKEEPSVIDE